MAIVETITCFSPLLVAFLLVLSSLSCSEPPTQELETPHKLCAGGDGIKEIFQGNYKAEAAVITRKLPCDEIYIVTEGETLQTIGDKCGDPFIVEENPHIHDPDDVFPGLVIKITPFKATLHI